MYKKLVDERVPRVPCTLVSPWIPWLPTFVPSRACHARSVPSRQDYTTVVWRHTPAAMSAQSVHTVPTVGFMFMKMYAIEIHEHAQYQDLGTIRDYIIMDAKSV